MGAYPWATSSVFPMEENLICCICGCWATLPTLLTHGQTDPFLDEAEADDALTRVAECQVHWADNGFDGIPSVIKTGDVVTVATGASSNGAGFTGAMRVYADADIDITIMVSVVGAAANGLVIVYEDDQTTIVDEVNLADASGTVTITAPGYYWVLLSASDAPPGDPTSISGTFTIDGGPNMQICTARAAWDDGGTTRYKPCT